MECNIKGCDKQAREFYLLNKVVRFGYCKGHTIIPDTLIKKIKRGYFMCYADRMEMLGMK